MRQNPTVWVVVGDKLGDNAQVEVVAQALGWPVEYRRLVFKGSYVVGKPRFSVSLYHVDLQRSDPLMPPWPDLVLTIGRRPAMVALWIKRQSRGRTKVVLFGRPKRRLKDFDLIVVPPQYLVPSAANVVRLDLPLIFPDPGALETARAVWQTRLAQLPKPLIAVMVGGATKPYRLDASVVRTLLDEVQAATGGQGSLYISTSRRTGMEVVSTLERCLPRNARLYRFGMDPPEENPYRALLALADAFVVTGDSVSMLVEVVRAGKPLAIFPLPVASSWSLRLRYRWMSLVDSEKASGLLQRGVDKLVQIGIWGYTRNLERIHRLMYRKGWAVSLKNTRIPFSVSRCTLSSDGEIFRVARKIQALVSET